MSTVEQRMNLVSRAQALKWSIDKICRTMGLAGGGTLALIRFEKGSSRDLETKYQLLLKAVDAAAGGPIPAAGNANAAVVNVLPSVANNAPDDDNDGGVEGLLWDKVELLYEERHNAEKRKKMLLLRDQILPIATYTGSIVVVITQFMDGPNSNSAIGLLVSACLAYVAQIISIGVLIYSKQKSELQAKAA